MRLLSKLFGVNTVTLNIPNDLAQALHSKSAALGISKTDLVCAALQSYLRVVEFRALREKLVPRTQALGIKSDEEVFRALVACRT